MRRTPQRLAILNYLEGNTNHPTVEDIYREVSSRFPTMSLATVYNTVKALQKSKRLTELRVETGKSRFDPNTSDHSHLVCLDCGRISDVFSIPAVDLSSEDKAGFEILKVEVNFYGKCSACKEKHSSDLSRAEVIRKSEKKVKNLNKKNK